MFAADLIGDAAQLLMIADLVFEFLPVNERTWIYNKMAMQVVCIQMNGDKHLIFVAPHPSCGFLTNFKCLLRRDLSFGKTLYAVIADNFSFHPEPTLYGNHFGISVLL